MKTLTAIILFALLLATEGCKKCGKGDENKGIIVSDYGDNNCLFFLDDKYVITSQAQLDSVGGVNQVSCDTPAIDFTKYSLLVFKSGTGCNTRFERRVDKDAYVPKYLYMLTKYNCDCKYRIAATAYNAVLVPALPAGYTVEFVEYVRP